jgi:serine phosphatase RsbU (regulator of sigma subunit)
MAGRRATGLQLAQLLAEVENAPPVAAADVVAEHLRVMLGASAVSFLIADFSGQALIRLGHEAGRETADRVPLAGSPQGEALATQHVQVVDEPEGGVRLLAPVTNRGEAIGVLELRLARDVDERVLDDVALTAHALAYVIIANRRFTDLFEWGQRSVPLSVAAEIQHRLLPGAYTCEAGQFTLAAWLEPAGNVGGDTFDFSLAREALHLSMTDAMGHTVEAAVLATVVVGALRNARRAGAGLAEQATVADAALTAFASGGAFVTGQLVRVDLRSGRARIVNAGHPPPIRMRDGRTEAIALRADPPFGTAPGWAYEPQELSLEPGDRLMFVTDGMLERNAADLELERLIAAGAHLHTREAVQHVVHALLELTGGALEDDASVLCLDWHGGPPRDRETVGGANA